MQYRAFLFLVTRQPSIACDSKHKPTADSLSATVGASGRPTSIGTPDTMTGLHVHCAVYSFTRADADAEAILDSPVDVSDALRQAGIIASGDL
jgi:hypothetical protein